VTPLKQLRDEAGADRAASSYHEARNVAFRRNRHLATSSRQSIETNVSVASDSTDRRIRLLVRPSPVAEANCE